MRPTRKDLLAKMLQTVVMTSMLSSMVGQEHTSVEKKQDYLRVSKVNPVDLE